MNKTRIIKQPKEGIRQIERIAKNLDGKNSVKVGLPKNSNPYPDGTSVILVGAVHEFGSESRSIPQRSYLRTTLKEKKNRYLKLAFKLSKKMVKDKGRFSMREALSILGLEIQNDVQKKIVSLRSPANAQSTKDAKGSTNPLIDTGHLRQSITYKVET